MRAYTETVMGKRIEGEVVEVDNGTLILRLADGSLKAVDADSTVVVEEGK